MTFNIKILELSTVPDYSVIKPIPKLCHNVLECVGIKCITLTSDDRFQVLQRIKEIPTVFIFGVIS